MRCLIAIGSRDLISKISRSGKVAALVWALFGFAPALVLALAPQRTGRGLGPGALLLDHAGQAYLSYCPRGVTSYTLALLLLGPALVMLLGMAASSPRSLQQLLGLISRILAIWSTANAAALLVLIVAATLAEGAQGVLGWALRLWFSLEVSILPALGLTALCAVAFRRRRPQATLLALSLVALVGLLGQAMREPTSLVTPGAVDRNLFSGNPERWSAGGLVAVAWLSVALVLCAGWLTLRHKSADQARGAA
jgi:hypothetical protein